MNLLKEILFCHRNGKCFSRALEVYPGIYKVSEESIFKNIKLDVNIYIIAGSNGIVFESGYGDCKNIKKFIKAFKEIKSDYAMRGLEFNISRILISHAHPDHFSGLKKLNKKLGLKIILTEKMAEKIHCRTNFRKSYLFNKFESEIFKISTVQAIFMKLTTSIKMYMLEQIYGIGFIKKPDIIIDDNCTIQINNDNWDIFLSPGHSDDHISLYNKEKGLLFSGDNVLKLIPWLGPPKSDLSQYIRTLEVLSKLPSLNFIFGSHGEIIEDAVSWIVLIERWREKRTQDILQLIIQRGACGITPKEIEIEINSAENRSRRFYTVGWIYTTLSYLEEKRLIRHVDMSGRIKYLAVKNG